MKQKMQEITKEKPTSILVSSFFVLSLLLTLFSGRWLGLAVVGWGGLAYFCSKDTKYGVWMVFFFASFFHAAGFPAHLFFTLKHFHIAVLLLACFQLIRREFLTAAGTGLRQSHLLWPMLVVIAIAWFSAIANHGSLETFAMTANIMLVLAGIVYLLGVILSKGLKIQTALIYYLAGIVLQVVVNFYNFKMHQFIFELDLLYNNQFASLTAFGSFFGIALALSLRKRKSRLLMWFVTAVILLGLIFTCSRTAWFSFFVNCFLFGIWISLYSGPKRVKTIWWIKIGVCITLVLLAGLLFMKFNYDISERVLHLYQIMDLSYWRYTICDHQNFGFFGILRLNQLRDIQLLLKQHLFMGSGFIKTVTDFHGFYFTLIGATGLAGALFFVLFAGRLVGRLSCSIRMCRNPRLFILGVGAFASLVVWLMSSFMQTMFVHFSVWINVLIAMVIEQECCREESRRI